MSYSPYSFNHSYVFVNGIKIHYVEEGKGISIVLCHGWPDLWFGWRKQIRFLSKTGFRVIAPSLRGFGETEAPESTTSYGLDSITTDLAKLLDHLNIAKALFVGHDHGGSVVWRMCLYYPERVIAVASVCTPYVPPRDVFVPLKDIVTIIPQFQYQLYFNTNQAQHEFEKDPSFTFKVLLRGSKQKTNTNPPSDILYMKNGPPLLQNIPPGIGIHPMLTKEEFDYYVAQYTKSGFRGGLNWYRTHKVNWEAEKGLKRVINHPALIILAEYDVALPPQMANKMDSVVPNLTKVIVKSANHWILQDFAEEVNNILMDWIGSLHLSKL